jgi:hypothetical protein
MNWRQRNWQDVFFAREENQTIDFPGRLGSGKGGNFAMVTHTPLQK